MKKTLIGIDVSSKTLDICIKKETEEKRFEKIDNNCKSIMLFFKQFNSSELVVAMENTGRYNWQLYEAIEKIGCDTYVINPLHLKKSMGLVRGKNDKVDAYRIALFTEKNIKEMTLWKPSSKSIKQLKILNTERISRIKMKRRMLNQQHDYKLMKGLDLDKELLKLNKQIIKKIDEQILKIETKITTLIKADKELNKQNKLIRSVPGVGKVLSWTLLAKTEGFKLISEPRKLACYAGVVPFEYQSGSSVYRKPSVSVFADKTIKSVLHMAAMSALNNDKEMKQYFERKVLEGKNKMSVINAIRNKIIHRVYAVIKRKTPYEINLFSS